MERTSFVFMNTSHSGLWARQYIQYSKPTQAEAWGT
jgi:hypothetical protein